MKKTLKLMTLLLVLVLLCVGTLPLTLAKAERSGLRAAELSTASHANLTTSLSFPAVVLQRTKSYQQDQDIAKVLRRHDSLELEPDRVVEQVRQTGRLSIPTAAGTFDLNLAPHDMRAANYRAEVSFEGGEVRAIKRGPVRTYKGTVNGMKGAEARFTIDENTVEGLIITPSDLYFVEPANRYSSSATSADFIAYKASDLIRTSFGECGVTMADKVGSEAARVESQVPMVKGLVAEELFTPARIVDLATEADFEYFTSFGASAVAANNEILSIMNQVEGIYDLQFGLQFRIVFQNVWATAGDPYNTTDASAALSEFASHWNSTRQGVARDLAHMWTGKSFDGSTVGIAYIDGIECPLSNGGYGMSERLSGNPSPDKFLLAAHEIGHNFGAEHSNGQPGCTNTIMGTSLGSSTQSSFCAFSVNEIEARANVVVACLSRAITPGCSYSLSPTSQSVGVSGGSGSTNVTTAGTNCAWGAESSAGWISVTSGGSGTNNGTVMIAVAANSAGFARSGTIRIADQSFTVSQAGSSACPVVPISYGQTLSRSLNPSDCDSTQPQQSGSLADQYSFTGAAGDQIRIDMTATGTPVVDTYLYLIGPSGVVLTENDDIAPTTPINRNSRIPVNGFFTLPAAGLYIIEATSYDVNEVGSYTLALTTANPIDGSQYFVTRHYEDFLGRQPDAGGLEYWTNNIEACGASSQCRQDRRVDTSAAFFLSIEFQETGYLVYRMYRAAYGEAVGQALISGVPTPIQVPIVRRQEFVPDTQRIGLNVVVGSPGWPLQLENNKVAYAQEFVALPRFTAAFPAGMGPQEFVDTLNTNAGSVLSATQGQNLINELTANNTPAGRASVLRQVAEDPDLATADFNKAFVLMQFFGYLQRNPNALPDADHSGYKFWLDKLNEFNGDFRQSQMVAAFMFSIEYRDRFVP